MSEAAAAAAAPAAPTPEAAPQAKPQRDTGDVDIANEGTETAAEDDSKLNPVQKFAKASRERKAAKTLLGQKAAAEAKGGSEKPATTAEGGARDEHGRFLPADGKPKDKPEPAAAAAAAKKPEPEPDVAAGSGVKAPEQKPGETNQKYELRISNLLREQKAGQVETLKMKVELETARKELERVKSLIERVNGKDIDGSALEELTSRSFERMVRDLREGGATYKPKANLPPEIAAVRDELSRELAEIKAEKARIASEVETAKAKEAKEADSARYKETQEREAKSLDEYLVTEADKYPHLSSLKNAGARMLDKFYQTWSQAGTFDKDGYPLWDAPKPDLEEVAASMETSLTGELSAIFGSERALRVALADPQTRDRVSKLLGTTQQIATATTSAPARNNGQTKTASAEGPPTLSNKVSQEAPVIVEKRALNQFDQEEAERKAYHDRMIKWNQDREAAKAARFKTES
jgi:hypothetical protein